MDAAEKRTSARTVLGELIQQRGWTAEEFSEEAERFAREHDLSATLSVRHVQRLSTGIRADGKPLGPLRPATRRLLEAIFHLPVDHLLRPVSTREVVSDAVNELRGRVATSRSIDGEAVRLLRQRLDITRVLDRRLGASGLLSDLRGQIEQIERMLSDALREPVRSQLAALLVDASTLAGWQSLDHGQVREAWEHYNRARAAAREAAEPCLEAYACAGQAVVLLDVGETREAVALTAHARTLASAVAPPMLAAWLAAGHGEALAADGDGTTSLTMFDVASRTLTPTADPAATPYLVFDASHLSRWRGSALARLGSPEAVDVLSSALDQLDPSFTRAETALRVDLVRVHMMSGQLDAAAAHAERARLLASQIGSARQRTRLGSLVG